jgi:hypothetical protein
MCPVASKSPTLKWFGVAIDGKGFFALDNVTPLPRVQPENLAYVLVDDPRASVEVIEDGLKKLVCEEWNWQVARLSETDFSVVFPNAVSLQLCKNATDLALPGSKIRIIVLDSICNPQVPLRRSQRCGLVSMDCLRAFWMQSASRPPWRWWGSQSLWMLSR